MSSLAALLRRHKDLVVGTTRLEYAVAPSNSKVSVGSLRTNISWDCVIVSVYEKDVGWFRFLDLRSLLCSALSPFRLATCFILYPGWIPFESRCRKAPLLE